MSSIKLYNTEILTEYGFKLFKDIKQDEKICVYDKDKNICKFEVPEKWQSYYVENEDAYHIYSEDINQIVAKNHKCLVERNGKLEFVFAENLNDEEYFSIKKIKNVLSLFDGISCARIGIEKAGYNIDKYYASEIDKYAIAITKKNYPDTIHLGDINNIDFTSFAGKIDLLIGGSPCQDLSIAKKNRQGLKGDRSKLFWKYVEALNTIKPAWFIFENVESMKKEDKNIITKELRVEPILIDSALVSAQQRKRLYWTNINGIQQPEDRHIYLQDILESGYTDRLKSYCIDAHYYKGTNLRYYNEKKKRQIVYEKPIDDIQFNSINKNIKIRKLTPIECERLQSIPDNYTKYGINNMNKEIIISNTQRYKCIGNAFNVDVITHILHFIPPQSTKAKVEKIKYTGLIFCPTVSTGAFVARQNGKIIITGVGISYG